MESVAETRTAPAQGAIFARAAELLASSGGYRDTLQKTLAACLPELGDFGFFDARAEGTVIRLAEAHEDERTAALLRATQWAPAARDDINLCALSSGLAALHDDIDDAWYRRVARDDAHLELMRALGFRSMLTVPMRCRGELIGALTLFMGRSGRRHALEHLSLAAQLAGLCAPAIANAALLERSASAEEAARERLRLSYEAAGLGAWDWNVATNEVHWSREYREIHGFDPLEPATFARGMQAVVEEDRAGVAEAVRRALETRSEYRSEHRIRHPARGVRWIQAMGRPQFAPDGQPVRMTGMILDVTERREAERLHAHMAAIIESSEDAIISATLDGHVASWNPGAARLYGYEAREILGEPLARLIPPELMAQEAQLLERVRSGERISHYETLRVARDGRKIAVSLTVSPVRDAGGRIVGISKIARDITERQRADAELLELRDRLAEELEAMRQLQRISSRLINRHDRLEDLLLEILDAALSITTAERGVIQLYDDEAGELRFAARRGFDAAFAERFSRVGVHDRLPSARALRERRRVVIEDIAAEPSLDASKREHLLQAGVRSLQCTPLVSRDGRLVGMFTTHSAHACGPSERELRMLDLLSRAAADLVDRAQAEASLLEADRRKDEFLAILAHELRNPLAPIRYAVSIAREAGSSEEQRRRAETVIERQVRHMGRLLDDLLDVSRIARGAVQLKRESVEVGAAIGTAVEAARPAIDAKRHVLQFDLPAESLWVDADPVRLTQILTNLLTNAAKYTEPGGRIRVSARAVDGMLELAVADSGIGIAESLRPRLFTLFAQADTALRRSEGGLGIGLALVKAFVELHGGTIEARSDGPGQGSEFVVRLPRVRVQPAGAPEGGAAGTVPARTCLRVLVADDNPDACETCAMLLELWGHETALAHDGEAALRKLEELRPDVALLDIGMPGLTGYEVAERVRAAPWGARMVLVAVTGWGQQEDRRRSAASGFDGHLTKPVEAAALERLLQTVQQRGIAGAAESLTSR